MADEAKINVATGFQGGNSVALRADSPLEFLQLAKEIYGDAAGELFVQRVFGDLSAQFPEVGAVQNVDRAIGVTSVTTTPPFAVSTVGQPLPQPGQPGGGMAPATMAPPAAAPAGPPPGVAYPGDCPHGQRVYSDKQAKGAPWYRWECATPYSAATKATRCKPINI